VAFLILFAATLRAESSDVLLTLATDAELQPLVAKLGSPHTENLAAWQFWTGTLAGKKIVLTRTEGDPLNAVAATTLAIRHYAPKLVVTIGAARAHDPALKPGDVVVSKTFIAFDGLVSQTHALGEGIHPLTWEQLPHAMMTPGEKEHYQTDFPADAATLATALKLTPARGRVVAGALGSAPQVNREADRIAWIHQTWKTDCEDTESAHIAGCALLFNTPVIGLRIIDGAPAETPALATQFLEALK
jgi:adenosylhomocysteine nucleosidase